MKIKRKRKIKMQMNQAPTRLSLRTAATTPPSAMNALLCAGLGAALLALSAACGDMDTGSDGFEGEDEYGVSELVDEFDPATDLADTIEKALFNDNFTFNGFNVGCTGAQKSRIREAEERANQILSIAGPANASARVNRTTAKALLFRQIFVPNGNTNPDPNRTSPDEWDTVSLRAGQKGARISQFLRDTVHTCHADNESLGVFNGVMMTCGQLPANAATDGGLGLTNEIRWCDVGLAQNVNGRAVTLLHEMTHHDNTNDATGGHVFDDTAHGPLYSAQNWARWFNNNTP